MVSLTRFARRLLVLATLSPPIMSGSFASADELPAAAERLAIQAPNTPLERAVLSPSGKFVAGSVSGDGRAVYVWETTSGTLKATLKGHENFVTAMSFSADEDVLTTFCTKKGTIVKRWKLATGELLEGYSLDRGGANKAISSHGRYLVTMAGFPNPTGIVWDLTKRPASTEVTVDSRTISSVAIDQDEKLIATGSSDGDIFVRELPSGKLVNKFKGGPVFFENNPKVAPPVLNTDPAVRFIDFSSDGKTIVAWNRNQVARLWSVADGKLLGTILKIKCEHCRFTPDGKYLVTMNSTVMEFRSARDGKILCKYGEPIDPRAPVNQLAISTDGKTAVFASGSKKIHVWKISEIEK